MVLYYHKKLHVFVRALGLCEIMSKIIALKLNVKVSK